MVGMIFKEIRKYNNLTLADVSNQTGTSERALRKFEEENTSLSYEKLKTIATIYKISLSKIFRIEEELKEGNISNENIPSILEETYRQINEKKIVIPKININAPATLVGILEDIVTHLQLKVVEYFRLFRITEFRDIKLNLFDNINEFKSFLIGLSGDVELPEYVQATFDEGMLNAWYEPNLSKIDKRYPILITIPSHELFHLFYKEIILKGDISKRVVWFDEGMAQEMSGEYDDLKNEEKFSLFFQQLCNDTKRIPDVSELVHGDTYCTDEYNGYNLCYLAVRYLKDTLNDDELYETLHNVDKQNLIGDTVLVEAFEYYEEKFSLNKSP